MDRNGIAVGKMVLNLILYGLQDQITFLYQPMMKLVRRITASGAACSPDFLVFFTLLYLFVKLHLDWTFHVFAEFSSFVLGEFV